MPKIFLKPTNLKVTESTILKLLLIKLYSQKWIDEKYSEDEMSVTKYCFYKSRIKEKKNENHTTINPGIKEAEKIQRWVGIKWIEEAVLCANLSFASDRFLFIIRRVASFHLGAENSRQLFNR